VPSLGVPLVDRHTKPRLARVRPVIFRSRPADLVLLRGEEGTALLALATRLDESRRQRWEKVTDWPLTIAAVVFLAAYATPILRPDLVSPWPSVCGLVAWGTWALFVVDYVARLARARPHQSADNCRHSLPELRWTTPSWPRVSWS
jgi:hypothetical protein